MKNKSPWGLGGYNQKIVIAVCVVSGLVFLFMVVRNSQTSHFPRPVMPSIETVCPNPHKVYNTRLNEWKFDDTRSLPRKPEMCIMSPRRLESLLHRYMSTIQVLCLQMARMGKLEDGGWEICHNSSLIPAKSCLVYSFGINYDFSFDDDIHETFGCVVHSFDPSMKMNKCGSRCTSRYFHTEGLAHFDGKSDVASWEMRTFKTIQRELNHGQKTIDVVKIDIEDWEWLVIPEMIKSSAFTQVKQLVIEFHFPDLDSQNTQIYWLHKLFALKDLYDNGFRIFWINKNIFCYYKSKFTSKKHTACYEVSFLKVR